MQNQYLEFRKRSHGPLLNFSEKMILLNVLASNFIRKEGNPPNFELYCWAAIHLTEIYVLFTDIEITEIYFNGIDNLITLYHRRYGRMSTKLVLSDEIWNSLKLQAELNSNSLLSRLTPSLKTGIETSLGNLRITLQIPPLSSGVTGVIRRLPHQPIEIEKLIEEGQVSSFKIEYLLHALLSRKNIIIAGQPSSGKTTLANALLLATPKHWRLIIIEDASELRMDPLKFPLAVKFSVPSVGQSSVINRNQEITKLLHRSPDYVFLGEIQNMSDTTTMFEGLSAGISGMATTHCHDLESLLRRWQNSYQVRSDLVSAINVFVITKRIWQEGIQKLEIGKIYEQVDSMIEEVKFDNQNL